MKVSKEDGMIWYEGNDRKAVVSKEGGGYGVTSFWDRDGTHWCGGYGTESRPLTLKEAKELAKRFIDGQSVPEELGGYEHNKPVEVK
jgi:hypothetical protein